MIFAAGGGCCGFATATDRSKLRRDEETTKRACKWWLIWLIYLCLCLALTGAAAAVAHCEVVNRNFAFFFCIHVQSQNRQN